MGMSDNLKKTLGIIQDTGNALVPFQPTGVDVETGEIVQFEAQEPAKLEIMVMPTTVVTETPTDVINDYQHARNVTYTLLEKTGDALAGALRVAQESEHPRAYDIVNQLATTMIQLKNDLLGLQKTYKDITKDQAPAAQGVPAVQNNQTNIFTGSTTDILRALADQRAQEENGLLPAVDVVMNEVKSE